MQRKSAKANQWKDNLNWSPGLFMNVFCTFSLGCVSTGKFHFLGSVRSSCLEVFCIKKVVKIVTKFTEKHLWRSLFFLKVTGLKLWKNKIRHRCFSLSFPKLLRKVFGAFLAILFSRGLCDFELIRRILI